MQVVKNKKLGNVTSAEYYIKSIHPLRRQRQKSIKGPHYNGLYLGQLDIQLPLYFGGHKTSIIIIFENSLLSWSLSGE